MAAHITGVSEIKEKTVRCSCCGTRLTIGKATEFRNKYYCKRCWEEHFVLCERCGIPLEKENVDTTIFSDITHKHYCITCYNMVFGTCEACGNRFLMEDLRNGADDEPYCNECWQHRFANCASCGNTCWREDLFEEPGNNFVCAECHRAHTGVREPERVEFGIPRREQQDGGRYINNYGYRPTPVFKELPFETKCFKFKDKTFQQKPLYLGFELEVEGGEEINAKDLARKLNDFLTKENVNDHFYFKLDASIQNGFEIVSHPFTILYSHKNMKLHKILRWLSEHDAHSYESGRCGLHIHIDKDFFSELEISKMRLFFAKNKEQLYKFSQRKGKNDNTAQYEAVDCKGFLRNTNVQRDRHTALNLLSSRNTLEIRIFRGTLNTTRFIACLQFAEAISYFVKEIGITSLIYGEADYKNNSWKLFTEYIKSKNKNEYSTLYTELRKESLCA